MKTFPDDEKEVRFRQNELQAEIDRVREMDRQPEEYIDELKKQMGIFQSLPMQKDTNPFMLIPSQIS